MAARFVFSQEAEAQLLEILDYLANESESAAVRVRDALYDAVGLLAESPGIGHTRERPDGPTAQVLDRLLVPRCLRSGEPTAHDHRGASRRPRCRKASAGLIAHWSVWAFDCRQRHKCSRVNYRGLAVVCGSTSMKIGFE
jgi:plasmid stabilization system protein ParE